MNSVKVNAPVYLLQVGGGDPKLDEVERKIKSAIPGLNRANGIDEVQKRTTLSGGRAYLLIVAQLNTDEYFAKLIDLFTRHRGEVFFILIGGELSGSRYKQLVLTGNADWVAEEGLPQEILEIIARQGPAGASQATETERPLVVTFDPSAGGVGNSTLAIETAIQLNRLKGDKAIGKVCLVDLDFQTSHVCDYLDIAPKFMVEEVIETPERLDAQLLELFTSRHASGLDVLAAPRNKANARDVSVDALSALFELIASRYDAVVVDLPVTRFAWTGPVLGASQAILIVGENTIPGLHRTLEAFEAVRAEVSSEAQVRVVLNKCEFGLTGRLARGDHIAKVLGEEKPFLVRRTANALDCVNVGMPITLHRPTDKAAKDIAAITEFCASRAPATLRKAIKA